MSAIFLCGIIFYVMAKRDEEEAEKNFYKWS